MTEIKLVFSSKEAEEEFQKQNSAVMKTVKKLLEHSVKEKAYEQAKKTWEKEFPNVPFPGDFYSYE